MSKRQLLAAITALLMQRAKDDVEYWQDRALKASAANDQARLRRALEKQEQAIGTLLRFAAV